MNTTGIHCLSFRT